MGNDVIFEYLQNNTITTGLIIALIAYQMRDQLFSLFSKLTMGYFDTWQKKSSLQQSAEGLESLADTQHKDLYSELIRGLSADGKKREKYYSTHIENMQTNELEWLRKSHDEQNEYMRERLNQNDIFIRLLIDLNLPDDLKTFRDEYIKESSTNIPINENNNGIKL